MPHRLGLGAHRGMVLVIRVPADAGRLQPALTQEEHGPVEIASVASLAVQLDQRELDLLVTVGAPESVRAERLADVIREAHRRVEQHPLARGPNVGQARLNQVPGAIQLVLVRQIRVPLACPARD